MNFIEESALLKALGHPVRLKIVNGLLQKSQCNVSMMARKLNLPQSTVSQHLGVLRAGALISAEKNGTNTCYKVINNKVIAVMALLKGK